MHATCVIVRTQLAANGGDKTAVTKLEAVALPVGPYASPPTKAVLSAIQVFFPVLAITFLKTIAKKLDAPLVPVNRSEAFCLVAGPRF